LRSPYSGGALGGPIRYFASGVATAASEPATWPMLLAGLVALGFAGYRRARRAQSAT
jgi:hypothetical protein